MPQLPRLPSQLTYNDLNGAEATEILVDWFRQLLKSNALMQPHLTLPMAKIALGVSVGIDMYTGGSVPCDAPPDHIDIGGTVDLDNRIGVSVAPHTQNSRHTEQKLSTVINAAPVPGGRPPDELRAIHGLPVPGPGYGPRETGSHLFLADVPDISGGRRGEVAEGYRFSEQAVTPSAPGHSLDQHIPLDRGEIHIDLAGSGIRHESGMLVKERTHISSVKEAGDERGKPYSSVNGVYDAGPAGLMSKSRQGGAGLGGDGRSRISFGNSHRG